MKIEERFTVPAPRQAVWAFLLDIPRASACMPGVTGVEQHEDGTYRGRIEVKVGPMKAGFATTVTITELAAPERIVLAIRGGDRGGSLVQATVTTTLAGPPPPPDRPRAPGGSPDFVSPQDRAAEGASTTVSPQDWGAGAPWAWAVTDIAYEMDIVIRGPLGRFGQTVIQDTARKMSRQFAACVERAVAAAPDEASGG